MKGENLIREGSLESRKMRPHFLNAIKVIENYLEGKSKDASKAKEAEKVIKAYVRLVEKETRERKKKYSQIKKEVLRKKR